MRPNNQNKNRQRGRNGGRKHVNPLSRNFESNGPDVKVRGNAAHIAEKYLQLARDAQSSGDSVMAENYLQHAEHYFRIVSAAQQQSSGQRFDGQNQGDDDFDDDLPEINSRFSSPQQVQQIQQPAPEEAEGETAEAPAQVAEAGGEAQPGQQDAQGEGRKPRERRPRRRRPQGGGEGGADPANAPQPEVGELPAFLTAGNTANAAE